MRRLTLNALGLLLVAGIAPGAGAAKAPPTVAQITFFVAVGTATVDVTIPRGVSLIAPVPTATRVPGIAGIHSSDQRAWGAVALISRSARSGGAPVNAVHVHPPHPDHCPSETAPTATPVPPCREYVEHAYVHGVTPISWGDMIRYPLPAGRYQVVVSAPPGVVTFVELAFAGAPGGGRGIVVTRRATASFQRTRHAHLATAHATGTFAGRLTANGIGVLGVWHTSAGDEPGEHTYAQCVTPGAAGPLDPDGCGAVATSGQAPPDQLGRKPLFWAASAGAVTFANSGQGTFQTPVLKPGTYVNSYRVTRGGRGPAAGAFVWWLQADALK